MNRRILTDNFVHRLLRFSALLAVLVLIGIFLMLVVNGIRTFLHESPLNFLTGTEWNPSAFSGDSSYGILSMLISTVLVTGGALLLAIPLGLAVAAYLSEIAPRAVREIVKPLLEMLAAIPSVVLGFVGIVVIGPFLASFFGLSSGLNALNGSILLAFMSLPTIITVAEDAIRSVPASYKEASYALGGTRWVTLVRITLPACASGLIAALMLGLGRAIGETMTVLMATGNATQFPEGYFSAVRTITATIAIELGEVPYDTTHYYSLFAIGLVLFLLTLGVNIAAEKVAANLRRKGR